MAPRGPEETAVALSPDLFKRLSRLNRQRLSEQVTTGDRVGSADTAASQAGAADQTDLCLERLMPGRACEAADGCFYRIRRGAEDLWALPQGVPEGRGETPDGDLLARYRRTLFGAARASREEDLHESVRPLVTADPARIVYLDIETCGLAGEPIFLVGLMRYRDDGLVVEQFLARDYSEERPMLAAVRDELGEASCLVTFNGKAFDVPTVEMRSVAWGLFASLRMPPHVDLLHEARRRWRDEVPNCRLQTLEQLICGRRRMGDIPGCDIPAAYHEFVRAHQGDDGARRSRSLRRLQTILHHTALDLITMAELVVHILATRAPR